MKTKDEVRTDGRAVFYAVLYPSMRRAALECGYALALHGSMESDLDLIAPKPHGRIVYSLSILGDYYIDLSIIPPKS